MPEQKCIFDDWTFRNEKAYKSEIRLYKVFIMFLTVMSLFVIVMGFIMIIDKGEVFKNRINK